MLFDDSIPVVAGSQSRWARRRQIELSELMDKQWVLPRPGTPASAIIADWFRANRMEPPSPAVICNSVHLQTSLLTTGDFLTLLPKSLLQFSAKRLGIKVLDIKVPPAQGPVGILKLKTRTSAPATQLFIDCIRDVAKPLRYTRSASKRR